MAVTAELSVSFVLNRMLRTFGFKSLAVKVQSLYVFIEQKLLIDFQRH